MHSVYLHYNISVIQAELVMIGHFFNHFTPDKYLRNYKSLTVPTLLGYVLRLKNIAWQMISLF